jgi:hypothetical protein
MKPNRSYVVQNLCIKIMNFKAIQEQSFISFPSQGSDAPVYFANAARKV